MSPAALQRRPERDDDAAFLRELDARSREDEFAALGWDDERLGALLAIQFDARQRHYRAAYPDAEFAVLVLDGDPIGRLCVDRRPGEILLVDIAVLPAHRRHGHARTVIEQLLAEATASDARVRLSVDRANHGAIELYRRLGFRCTGEQGVSWVFEWRSART